MTPKLYMLGMTAVRSTCTTPLEAMMSDLVTLTPLMDRKAVLLNTVTVTLLARVTELVPIGMDAEYNTFESTTW